jgi:hypothetical protein
MFPAFISLDSSNYFIGNLINIIHIIMRNYSVIYARNDFLDDQIIQDPN